MAIADTSLAFLDLADVTGHAIAVLEPRGNLDIHSCIWVVGEYRGEDEALKLIKVGDPS